MSKSNAMRERERAYKPIIAAIRAERELVEYARAGDIVAPGKMVEVGTLDDRALVFLARDLLREYGRNTGGDDMVAGALVILERETRGEDALMVEIEADAERTRKRRAEQARKNFRLDRAHTAKR